MNNNYFKKNIIQMIISLFVIIFLSSILISTIDLLTKIVVAIFLTFIINQFLMNLFFVLNKNNIAVLFKKINLILFFVYWFGFLFYWNYININKHEYMSVLFSIPFLFMGVFMVYKEFKRKWKGVYIWRNY